MTSPAVSSKIPFEVRDLLRIQSAAVLILFSLMGCDISSREGSSFSAEEASGNYGSSEGNGFFSFQVNDCNLNPGCEIPEVVRKTLTAFDCPISGSVLPANAFIRARQEGGDPNRPGLVSLVYIYGAESGQYFRARLDEASCTTDYIYEVSRDTVFRLHPEFVGRFE